MIERNRILAHRYAQAFVRAFGSSIDVVDIDRFRQTADVIAQHKKITIFLSLPCVDDTYKYQIIDRVCTDIKVSQASRSLVRLLLKHKRVELLVAVLHAIADQLYQLHAIEFFTIESFPELNHEQVEAIEHMLMRMTRRTVLYRYRVNASLIAGIRAQSASYLYDRCIAAKLRAVSQLLTNKG